MAMNLCALFVHDTLPLKPKQGLLSLDIPPDFSFFMWFPSDKISPFHDSAPKRSRGRNKTSILLGTLLCALKYIFGD